MWTHDFGNRYLDRQINQDESLKFFFENSLAFTYSDIESVIEFGAGDGRNLKAIHKIYPRAELSAIEINRASCDTMRALNYIKVHEQSIIEPFLNCADLVLTKGVLIHIPPEHLQTVYQRLYKCSLKYILICEYYNPSPVEVNYRGHEQMLWKRDFAGEMLDMFPDLRLVDYGFVYHRDEYPLDDVTWFLMEKANAVL